MKRLVCVGVLLFTLFSVISCAPSRSATELLCAFVDAYGAEGVIYSPTIPEGDDGYIDRALFDRIYLTRGELPEDFAVLLNSHTDSRAECAVFICRDGAELERVYSMCEERLRLLAVPESSFIIRCGSILFYSTLPEPERARRVWYRVIS